MTETRFHILLRQFLANEGKVQDWRELEALIKTGHHDNDLRLMFDELYEGPEPKADIPDTRIRAILQQVCISRGEDPKDAGKVAPRIPMLRWWAAAVLLLIAGAGVFILRQHKPVPLQPGAMAKIKPASDKATLTLSDGRTILLDTAGNGKLTNDGGIQIINLSGGRLQYQAGNSNTSAVAYNTLKVPRGGKFSVLLPDGTNVWLNSASSLKYPASFSGKERSVELDGEAYFEVAPKSAAFIVKTGNLDVQVLGTAFNIMAYKDEGKIAATLVEGKVLVKAAGAQKLLKPKEQASLTNGTANLQVSTPDLEEVLAWKNGEFRFNHGSLSSILRQVARWYDVAIVYQSAVPEVYFDGVVSRKSDVGDLLEVLEATHAVHFKVEEKRIVVIPGTR
ncbi:FecR family protein [Filimonas effusa]|uniref:DUF4974 domain-containing protein n=1 Tax=Filimonas effusa TaxID=2508721 RepID=A0A4Q1D9B1_9BACT|nr:FecR domain-containing protein [Filimonas effusa]RXK85418.1 DUF4974 domain-containing protein [Filimonas effusa]